MKVKEVLSIKPFSDYPTLSIIFKDYLDWEVENKKEYKFDNLTFYKSKKDMLKLFINTKHDEFTGTITKDVYFLGDLAEAYVVLYNYYCSENKMFATFNNL